MCPTCNLLTQYSEALIDGGSNTFCGGSSGSTRQQGQPMVWRHVEAMRPMLIIAS